MIIIYTIEMDLIFSKLKMSKIKINEDIGKANINKPFVIESIIDSNKENINPNIENNNINMDNSNIDNYENPNLCQEVDNKEPIKELTADGIPTIEQQLKDIKEDEEKRIKDIDEIKEHRRNMLMRVKCLCLNKMGKSMFVNTNTLNNREKDKLIKLMNTYTEISSEHIIEEFNELCQDKLFLDGKDYSNLPVYDV